MLESVKQRVKFNSIYSDWFEILVGISERSSLGPLLFNTFCFYLLIVVILQITTPCSNVVTISTRPKVLSKMNAA